MGKKSFHVLCFLFLFLLFIPINSIICYAKQTQNNTIDIIYFYADNCLACKANSHFIEELEKNKNVNIKKYDTVKSDCKNTQINYAKAYNLNEKDYLTVPVMYIGNKVFIIDENTNKNEIKQLINDYINNKIEYKPIIIDTKNCNTIQHIFNNIITKSSFWEIMGAGLIDGINPCAISILLLFCSFMVFFEKKKKVIFASICFIIGIFTANLIYGLGITYFYNILSGNKIVISILYGLAILMCIMALIINTHDIIIQIKNNKKDTKQDEIKNQIPTSWKYAVTKIAKKSLFSKFIIPSTLIAGFLVGSIELACTGQIYYPTITYIINNNSLNSYLFFLLICYNIMFILPLIIIMIIGIIVQNPEIIKKKIMQKTYVMKIIANLFFIIMFILLIKEYISFV